MFDFLKRKKINELNFSNEELKAYKLISSNLESIVLNPTEYFKIKNVPTNHTHRRAISLYFQRNYCFLINDSLIIFLNKEYGSLSIREKTEKYTMSIPTLNIDQSLLMLKKIKSKLLPIIDRKRLDSSLKKDKIKSLLSL